jgi:16S rRNA (cytosine967-C5)-methyltransferase
LAKSFAKGREKFINGVLREYIREKDNIEFPHKEEDYTEYLSVEYSFRPWIIELWMNQFGEKHIEELLKACNETPRLTLRVNALKISRDQLIERLKDVDDIAVPSTMSKETLHVEGGQIIQADLYKNGFYSVQDDSSYLAVRVLDPQPGELIIDTCAAPGGKTFAMAERMRNKGRIIAMDIYLRKLREITTNATRLGIDIVETKSWDSRRADSTLTAKADRVIVDAPCSALGLVRRKPEIKYKEWEHKLAIEYPRMQLDILKSASSYLKPGGTLVYCTCTLDRMENESVVKKFLEFEKTFKKDEDFILLPHINHTNGFYICKLKKSSNIAAV